MNPCKAEEKEEAGCWCHKLDSADDEKVLSEESRQPSAMDPRTTKDQGGATEASLPQPIATENPKEQVYNGRPSTVELALRKLALVSSHTASQNRWPNTSSSSLENVLHTLVGFPRGSLDHFMSRKWWGGEAEPDNWQGGWGHAHGGATSSHVADVATQKWQFWVVPEVTKE